MKQLINKTVVCKTPDDTEFFGKKLAALLPQNSSIALIGGLGAGKTTFVRGLAKGFNVEETVSSPTFNILNIYHGDVTMLHVDAYRLNGTQLAADSIMIEDFLIKPYCLVVEWPELLYGFLVACDFQICFSIYEDLSREILIKKFGNIA